MTNRVLSTSPDRHSKLPSVLGYPKFTALWVSETISLIGDRILLVAMIDLIYQQTQSATSVSLLSMIKALPALVLGTIAGVFIDRWSHKWTMVIANLLQGLLVLLIPMTKILPIIFAIYLGMSIISQFFTPARSATIPDLVPNGMLLAANSIFAIGIVVSIVIGPALGGWIIDLYGLEMAFNVDAFTFLVPAVVVTCLALPRSKHISAHSALSGEWRDGLRLVRDNIDIHDALILIGVTMMQIASLSVLGIIILDQQLGMGAAGLGALMSFMGVGMLIGAIAQNLLKRRFSYKQLASAGAIVSGLGVTILPWMQTLLLCMFCTFTLGLGLITVQANAQTILQNAPEQMRGRVLGMGQTISGSITFLAAGLIGILAREVGTQAAFMISGSVAIVSGICIIWLQFRRSSVMAVSK